MRTLSLKNLVHGVDLPSLLDEGLFIALSLAILIPLALFLYAVYGLIMCLVQNMCVV